MSSVVSIHDPENLLPPFGIRDLNSPNTEPGIIRISEIQYNDTIKSQPDARLTYLDDDDGELITVGSGFELHQRLNEPVTDRRPRFERSHNSLKRASIKDQKIHLFDIQHTSQNLVVWRDHEAYSSKILKETDRTSQVKDNINNHDSTVQPSLSPALRNICKDRAVPDTTDDGRGDLSKEKGQLFCTSKRPNSCYSYVTRESEATSQSRQNRSRSLEGNNSRLGDVVAEALVGLETHVVGFSDFLESSASALRVVAEKDPKTDISPAESFLANFKHIVTEAGSFGLDVLRSLDQHASTLFQDLNSRVADSDGKASINDSSRQDVRQLENETDERPNQKRVSFATLMNLPNVTSASEPAKLNQSSKSSQYDRDDSPSLESTDQDASYSSTHTRIINPSARLVNAFEPPAHQNQDRPMISSVKRDVPRPERLSGSILDIETSDSEFSSRYPPLMSLRRANTIAGPGEVTGAAPLRSAMDTQSAMSRFPSLGELEARARSLRATKSTSGLRPKGQTQRDKIIAGRRAMVEEIEKVKGPSYGLFANRTSELSQTQDLEAGVTESSELYLGASRHLPGSWPETKADGLTPLPSAEADRCRPGNENEHLASNSRYVPPSQTSGGRSQASRDAAPPQRSSTLRYTPSSSFQPSGNLQRARTVTTPPKARPSYYADSFPSRSNNLNRELHPIDQVDELSKNFPKFQGETSSALNNQSKLDDVVPTLWSNFPRSEPSTTNLPPIVPRPFLPFVPRPPPLGPPMHGPPMPMDSDLRRSTPTSTSYPSRPLFDSPSSLPQGPRALFARPLFDSASRPSNHAARQMRDESSFAYPPPAANRQGRAGEVLPPQALTSVEDCIKVLKDMGYGLQDSKERDRLGVYAGAAAGNVEEAIEMIEEDRQAAAALEENQLANV